MLFSTRWAKTILLLIVTVVGTACTSVTVTAVKEADTALPVWNDAVSEITEVTSFGNPIDSTPSPDGQMIYFTATAEDTVGVYAVPAAGGDVQTLLAGEPLVTPQGLAVSRDGQTLFVADIGADHLWSLPSAGGQAAVVVGTEGTAPVGVEVKAEEGGEMVYFSGRQAGMPGVWKVAVGGGTAVSVAQGPPLITPMGIAIANDGTVYVVDHDASGKDRSSVFRIKDGQVETIAADFRAGNLAGAAMTEDEGVLLVSALDGVTSAAQVLLIKLASLERGIVNKVISANLGSGGVHRAHNINVFSWADYKGPKGEGQSIQEPGHVYIVKP